MDDGIVGRVEGLALELAGQHGDRAVVLVAHHLAIAMLAGDLAPLPVEGVAVAVARRVAKDADLTIILQAAQLDVIRDVAPQQEAAHSVPGRTLQPQSAGPQALDGRVADPVLIKSRGDRDDVGVGIVHRWCVRTIVAVLLGQGSDGCQGDRADPGRRRLHEGTPSHQTAMRLSGRWIRHG